MGVPRCVTLTGANALNSHSLWPLSIGRQGDLGRVEGGLEESVNECRLAKTGLAYIATRVSAKRK